MRHEEGAAAGGRVEGVRRQIDAWRGTRPPGSSMPRPLWSASVALAREMGIGPAARALRVDYGTLKRRVEEGSGSEDEGAVGPAGFVELPAVSLAGTAVTPGMAGAPGMEVEVSDAGGAKLVIRVAGGGGVDVAGVVAAFWRRGS